MKRQRNAGRRGAALIWVLVVLSVLTTASGAAVWQVVHTRRMLDARENRAQAEWLARAGCEAAVARLRAAPDGYTGETLQPAPGSDVRVVVNKEPAGEAYHVECEARYPATGRGSVVRTATRTVKRVGDRAEVTAP